MQAGDPAAIARTICDRHSGPGADGWILIDDPNNGDPASIELWNSDGSRSEISGNGTRCAGALLVESGMAEDEVRISTGAGIKTLRLLERHGHCYSFEMNMGRAVIEEPNATLVPGHECVIMNVGNPQCAVFTADFEFDWRATGCQEQFAVLESLSVFEGNELKLPINVLSLAAADQFDSKLVVEVVSLGLDVFGIRRTALQEVLA